MAGIARQSHEQQVHYLRKRVNYNDAGVATGVYVGTLPAGAIVTAVKVLIATAFNAATTNVVNVGTTATGAELGASAEILAGAAGQKSPTAYTTLGAMAADQDVWVSYTQTGTAASAGVGYVIVTYVPNNDL
jgi:hypothetical protein